ncbi:MAG: hypothetical protein AAF485_05695 [Chloroflexota bacterium]
MITGWGKLYLLILFGCMLILGACSRESSVPDIEPLSEAQTVKEATPPQPPPPPPQIPQEKTNEPTAKDLTLENTVE